MSEQQIYYEKLSEEAEMMKKDSLIVGKNIDTLNEQMKRYQAVEQRWKDIISELT